MMKTQSNYLRLLVGIFPFGKSAAKRIFASLHLSPTDMTSETTLTLANPADGSFLFRVLNFQDNSHFKELQRNNYFSIIWIQEGSGKLRAGFSECPVSPGTMWFFAPFEPHLLDCQAEIKGLMMNFHPDFFCIIKHQKEVACNGILFNNIYMMPSIQVSEADSRSFHEICDQIKKEIPNADVARQDMLVSYLKIFLIQATRLKVQQTPAEDQLELTSDEPLVLQSLRDAIETHFREKRSAGEYAEMLNISPKALARVCKKHFNRTLTELISERIVMEAKRELYLTKKAVKEIAYTLGFADEYYFSRYFKNVTKVSPLLYRESLKTA